VVQLLYNYESESGCQSERDPKEEEVKVNVHVGTTQGRPERVNHDAQMHDGQRIKVKPIKTKKNKNRENLFFAEIGGREYLCNMYHWYFRKPLGLHVFFI